MLLVLVLVLVLLLGACWAGGAKINPEAAKCFIAELACFKKGGEHFAPLEDCLEADFGVICWGLVYYFSNFVEWMYNWLIE